MTEATPKPITVEKLKEAREMDAQINSSRNDAEYSTATNGLLSFFSIARSHCNW
jgi:hypothetical protein